MTKLLILTPLLVGCTTVTVNPPANPDAGHTNVMTMPSVSTCFLAACDIVTSDRASRAGEDLQNKNDLRTDQKAEAPISLPLGVAQ
jgi:hypothetical protein